MALTEEEKAERRKERAAEEAQLRLRRWDLIISKVQPWHTSDNSTYLDLRQGESSRTLPVRSAEVLKLIREVFELTGNPTPSATSVDSIVGALESKAIGGPCRDIVIRKGQQGGTVYYDLAGPGDRVVAFNSEGWQLSHKPPVRFFRPSGLLPQVEPKRGGSLALLQKYVRLSEKEWHLFLGWLIGCFNPVESYPVLLLNGEQGSSKSTVTQIARRLIDPHATGAFQPPKEDRDLKAYVKNTFLLAFDNVSTIPHWLSDDLCRIATGSSALTGRTLYTTAELTSVKAVRPIILNGIPDFIERGDLMDRCVQLTLLPIPEDERKTEKELWDEFEKDRPLILGALFDAVVEGLKAKNTTPIRLPRMADWAKWVCQTCHSWGQTPDEFCADYWNSKGKAEIVLIGNDPFADAVVKFIEAKKQWTGRISELRQGLMGMGLTPIDPAAVGWPQKDVVMTNALKRIAPVLKRMGIEYSSRLMSRYVYHELRLPDGKVKTSVTNG